MSGTKAGAAKRPRCERCRSFDHPGKPCWKPGGSSARKTPEERAATRRATANRWRAANAEKVREAAKRDRDALRLAVLTHYSTGETPECACCREDTLVFLTLDHVDGGGAEARRKANSRGGTDYYRRLRRAGYPSGYRVLCWNCNAAYGQTGSCPHEGAPFRVTEKVNALVR